MGHRRAPCVEHGDEADLGAEMVGIGGDGEHGLGARLEQDVVEDALVLIGDVGDRLGQGEDDVEVADRGAVLPLVRQASPWPPRPGTWGNGGCGMSCRRCGRDRSPCRRARGHRGRRCGSARWRSSPSTVVG